jgi:hypothetical protein
MRRSVEPHQVPIQNTTVFTTQGQPLSQQQSLTGIQQPLAAQQYLDSQEFLHGGQPHHLGGDMTGHQYSGQQVLLPSHQFSTGQQVLLPGQQQYFSTGQVLQGATTSTVGSSHSYGSTGVNIMHTVSTQSSIAAASHPSKIITIEEKPAVITTVTTSEAPIQVETQTNLIQETIQTQKEEVVIQHPVVQPVVEMRDEIIGMQPVIGKVAVNKGFIETGVVQEKGVATGGSTVISSQTSTFPLGGTETHTTGINTGVNTGGVYHHGHHAQDLSGQYR